MFKVVPTTACPKCGAYWGHNNPALNFANRPKVSIDGRVWWWRCYNPNCSVAYWNPETNEVELDPPS